MQDFKFDERGDLVINELKQVETVSNVEKKSNKTLFTFSNASRGV